ncbi:MAG: DUF397 domain-containing protein [Stackebrandtia sp.]
MSSTRSFGDGLTWRKARRSGDSGGSCVYVAVDDDRAGVRDSKLGNSGPQLWMNRTDLAALLHTLK